MFNHAFQNHFLWWPNHINHSKKVKDKVQLHQIISDSFPDMDYFPLKSEVIPLNNHTLCMASGMKAGTLSHTCMNGLLGCLKPHYMGK